MIGFFFFRFLVITITDSWVIPHQPSRSLFLALASMGFILVYGWRAAIIVLFLSLFSYGVAGLIQTRRNKHLFYGLGVILLVAFKYFALRMNTLNDLLQCFNIVPVFRIECLLLLLGISYITFKHTSYLSNVYWKVADRGKVVDFLCDSSLLRIFIAGPMERFESQVEGERTHISALFLEERFTRIADGSFKKVVIADWID